MISIIIPTYNNSKQLIINNRKFSASDEKGEVLVKSKWSTIELDNFLKIPISPLFLLI